MENTLLRMKSQFVSIFLGLLTVVLLMECAKNPTEPEPSEQPREGILMATNEMRILKSVDDGQNWTVVFDPGHNMYLHGFFVNPDDPSIVAGWGGLSLWSSTDGGNSWREADEGLYMDWTCCCQDWSDPNILYAGGRRILGKGRIAKSNDLGRTWILCPEMSTSIVWCMVIDPVLPNVLYVGTQDMGILKSTDGGDSWTPSNHGFVDGNSAFIYYLAVEPGVSPLFWATAIETVQTEYGPISQYVTYTSDDHGETWLRQEEFEGFKNIVGLAPNYSLLYGVSGEGLSKSTDNGETWTSLTSPEGGVLCLFLDQVDSTLYLGNYRGLYRSIDGGETFECLTEDYEFREYQAGVVATCVVH